jgi:hypothetical protein
MSRLKNLKSAVTLGDLAGLLQFKPSRLSYILYKQPTPSKYTTFEIPKRKGGIRTIKAPFPPLKLVQQRLSILLQDCVDEINKAKNGEDRIAHGFKRKRSIITNARQHRNRRYVFNIDLEGFFPAINFGRVRGYFIKDKSFTLAERVATVIAQIACHENALPQGSPCSPVISNLIAHALDIHLVTPRFKRRMHLFTVRGRFNILNKQEGLPRKDRGAFANRAASLAAWSGIAKTCSARRIPYQFHENAYEVPDFTAGSYGSSREREN